MWPNIINAALIFSSVLILASLSGLVSERVGIVNIGINGMMIIGALVFRIMGNAFNGEDHKYTIIFALLIASLCAGVFALLHGFATIVIKADHVVSGTAINLLAAGIGLFITPWVGNTMQEVHTSVLTPVYQFKNIGTTAYSPLTMYYIAFAFTIASSLVVYFKYTRVGLRHKSIGENPNAADSAAIKVIKYKWMVVFFSGMLAGLAGGMAMLQINTFSGNVQGLGFVALAIMILGQWRIPFIVICSFAFSILWGYANYNSQLWGMPQFALKMIPFVLSLIALVALSKFQAAPKAVGQHFDKAKR